MLRLPPVPYQSPNAPHPFDHETASLRVRGARRRALNYESHQEPHFMAKKSSSRSKSEER
jgi:hypothetical protein